MATKLTRVSKIELVGGQAKPGPLLASLGIDMGKFTKEFNDKTNSRQGEIVPTIIHCFSDRSFKFELKTSPTSIMIKKELGMEKASSRPKSEKVGTISMESVEKIAKYKLADLNTNNLESAKKIVIGTAKSMGIDVGSKSELISNSNSTDKKADNIIQVKKEEVIKKDLNEEGESKREEN